MSKIITRVGDIITVTDGLIVHQVNAQGQMGSGVAAAIKKKWPQVFEDYQRVVGHPYTQPNSGADLMGRVIVTEIDERLAVCSLVGQQFFGNRPGWRFTSYDALDVGFKVINNLARKNKLSVHIPLIGCGLGGASWDIVSAIIESNVTDADCTLWELK